MPKTTKKEIDERESLLIMKLQKMYDIEIELTKALPKMVKNAQSEELKRALEEHLKETESQAQKIEELFIRMDMKPKKIKSEAIRGHITDAELVMKTLKDPEVRDVAIIEDSRGVEHMEISCYTSLIKMAMEMGRDDIAEVAARNMEEEVAAESKLREIGERNEE